MGPAGVCTPCREVGPCYRASESGDREGNPGWSSGTVLPEATRSSLIWKGSEESFSNGMRSSNLQKTKTSSIQIGRVEVGSRCQEAWVAGCSCPLPHSPCFFTTAVCPPPLKTELVLVHRLCQQIEDDRTISGCENRSKDSIQSEDHNTK